MRLQPMHIPLVGLALLAAACSKGAGQGDNPVAAAEAVAAGIQAKTKGGPVEVAAAGPVETTSAGGPKRRDGWWEMGSFTADGSPMATQSLCVGAGSEEKFSVFDQLTVMGNCNPKELSRSGAGWSFHTRCQLMTTVNESKGTISGDFRQSFRVDQTIVSNEAGTLSGSIRGQWKGACPAGRKPGDMVSGTAVFNVLG